jgi:hypothetical protein
MENAANKVLDRIIFFVLSPWFFAHSKVAERARVKWAFVLKTS